MTKQIEVLDSLPGSGKTEAIFKYMASKKDTPWIYITPMLSELEERLPDKMDELDLLFEIPESKTGKSKSLQVLEYLKEGKSFACTHELTLHFSKEHIYEISLRGYNVVCDEELNLIEAFGMDKSDFSFLYQHKLIEKDTNDFGRISFLDTGMSYDAKYGMLKRLCDRGCLYGAKDNDNMLVTYLSPDLILAANRFILLTYNFGGSIMRAFLSLHNITHSYLDIELYRPNLKNKQELRELIDFVEPPSVKKFLSSQNRFSLSNSWWERKGAKMDTEREKVRKLLGSLPKNHKVRKEHVFFTIPLNCSSTVKSNNTSIDNLLAFNIRATNNYEDKLYAIHALNVFSNVTVSSYLSSYGFVLDEDDYALNTIIQWLFRGCIRKRERMKVTFLCARSGAIFKNWLSAD